MSSEEHRKIVAAIDSARENIALITSWARGRDLEAIKSDAMVRYAIERAFIAIDAALKDIPPRLLSAHAIPAHMIAGFRNVLAHSYDDIMDERVILTIKEDLPALDRALAAMSSALSSEEQ